MQLKDKRLLAVFAHPDDESFCCGGSLAKAVRAGVRIQLLCATRGEDGEWYGEKLAHEELPGLPDRFQSAEKERELAETRGKELEKAARIIGIEQIEYLSYVDGCLCNRDLSGITQRIEKKIKQFKPQVVLTFDRRL